MSAVESRCSYLGSISAFNSVFKRFFTHELKEGGPSQEMGKGVVWNLSQSGCNEE